MTTIAHTSRRYSPPEQEFIACQGALLSYITSRLPVTDWHKAGDLAQQTWTRALSQPRHPHAADTDDVPGWIAYQARIVLRRHLSPVPAGDADWSHLTQLLGPSTSWPEHWHGVLADEGQDALLRLAAREVIPTPSAVFQRCAAPVAVAA
ncbi:hypothetical protein AB0M05_41515 [Streptomyces violaceusniger]|uniref:hypothetical protein n=1 Tax=Streptomyces violaceusniger TaxID=68280 RepID=UPI00344A9D5E